MSRQRKTAAVLRLLRGEDLETVSRALGVTAATLSGWRVAFLHLGVPEQARLHLLQPLLRVCAKDERFGQLHAARLQRLAPADK